MEFIHHHQSITISSATPPIRPKSFPPSKSKAMLVKFSPTPLSPSSSSSFSSLFLKPTTLKSPPLYFPLRPKTHFSKPISSSSFSSFGSKNRPFDGYPVGRKLGFRLCAVSGFDLTNFESVLEAVGVLTTIIVVHESGHFLAAYLQGIHVSKFSVGFGPILAKFNSNNVEYSLRAFPLGGFVGFPDNDPESDIPVDDVNLLKNRPIFDRVVVISAGVVANVIFAFVIIFVQVLSVGLPVQKAFPGVLVPQVRAASAASRDGLLPGDVILAINGIEFPRTGPDVVSKVVDIVKGSPEKNVLLRVGRGEREIVVGVMPDLNYDGNGKIGVQLSPNVKITKVLAKNLLEAINFTGKEFWNLSSNVLDSLKQTFLNFSQTASKVAGPVAIIAVGAEVARSNVDGLFQFAALLNINLAIINLLPLPALDGGSLALILVEAVRGGKKIPLELEQRITSSGVMLVVLLGLFLIVKDTLNLDIVRDLLLSL